MTKAQVKVGDIIENSQGYFAKVLSVNGTRYGLSAWVLKKDKAAAETVTVIFLNRFGIAQVMKEEKTGATRAPKAQSTKDVKKAE